MYESQDSRWQELEGMKRDPCLNQHTCRVRYACVLEANAWLYWYSPQAFATIDPKSKSKIKRLHGTPNVERAVYIYPYVVMIFIIPWRSLRFIGDVNPFQANSSCLLTIFNSTGSRSEPRRTSILPLVACVSPTG
jgi:hypothetical protein